MEAELAKGKLDIQCDQGNMKKLQWRDGGPRNRTWEAPRYVSWKIAYFEPLRLLHKAYPYWDIAYFLWKVGN